MPVITIFGIPGNTVSKTIDGVVFEIKTELTTISDLGVKMGQVTVFMPLDFTRTGSKIVVYIDLFDKPGRTPAVKYQMAETVGHILSAHFNPDFIEVMPYKYDPDDQGYWSYRKE